MSENESKPTSLDTLVMALAVIVVTLAITAGCGTVLGL